MNSTKDKENLLVISIVLIFLYLVFKTNTFIYLAVIISFIGIVSHSLTKKISIAWLWVGQKMGFVVSGIILLFVFYIVLTPVALLSKMFLKVEFTEKNKTIFKERNHTFTYEDFEKTW